MSKQIYNTKSMKSDLSNFLNHALFKQGDSEVVPADYPRITVVTPSYNQGVFLERTILSVLNQNYPNLEYIIMDGGSSDHSVEIIKKYEPYLNYWQSEPDKGQTDAIEKGFSRATGDILAWLNSDDTYTQGSLLSVAELFKRHTATDLIYGDTFIINAEDEVVREMRSVPFSRWGFLTDSFSLHQASMFWRRSLYNKVRGLNSELYLEMDRDLWFQFYASGGKFRHLRRPLSCYRAHEETKTFQDGHQFMPIRNRLRKEILNVDATTAKFKFMKKLMRFRTLGYHCLIGNLPYLASDAHRSFYK